MLSKIVSILLIIQIILLGATGVTANIHDIFMEKTVLFDDKWIYNISRINITFESNNYTLYGEIYYPSNETGPFPGIVFCEGLYGYVSAYNWIPRALAENGYVVIVFDFPGQGKSDGIFSNRTLSIPFLNLYLRFSSLIESPYHYKSREWVTATRDALTYLLNESVVNYMINKTCIGLVGHSLGGVTVTETAAQDKRVDAVVALSQGNPLVIDDIDVPMQFQGGCLDSGTYSVPILHSCYRKADTPKEMIMISCGTHLGFTTALGPLCPCPKWQKNICLRYTIGWFDYFLKNKPDAYATITTDTNHLSKIIKSRYDFGDGDHILQ